MKKRLPAFFCMLLMLCSLLSGCAPHASALQDGYYTAEEVDYNEFGWKEFVTIYVSDGKIVTVEYDAKNPSGFVRSWDMNYMRVMSVTDGTYPNEYTRSYKTALLNWQDPSMVDAISGATGSYLCFQMLSEAAIEKARAGDKQVALVNVPYPTENDAAED